MASAAMDFGIGRILNVLEDEVLRQIGLREEIEMMKRKLMFMKSFLEDMDKHRGNTSSNSNSNKNFFATFVKNTRDFAFQIENIIDEFSYNINRRLGQAWLKRAAHFPMYMWKRRLVVGKLETMNRKLQDMIDSMKTFHGALCPIDDGGNTKWVKNIQESAFFVGDENLVGIDDAKEKLTGWLLDPEPQRVVVTVVGMGGSGKTSLVGNIFRSQRVRRHFSTCSWVTISQSYDSEDVFRNMIKEYHKESGLKVPHNLSSTGYRELVKILVDYVQQKRYLVVLDDVWNTGSWKEISAILPDGIHGSRVMITTREERVASFNYGTISRSHRVQPLSEVKAWELFCKKAFSGNLEQNKAPNIEPIARNFIQKCEGLPLAIVNLGSMMSTRRLESEWRKVHNNLNWELSNNPDLKDIQGILVLSFNDLPYPLKHCFLYCSIFPEDYIIQRKRLIRMWMAQGFVEPNGGRPEEVADSYLMELVYRNLLQVVLRNNDGRPKLLKMHDMVREVSLVVSREERFSDIYNDNAEETHHDETRHLCIQREISSGITRQNLRTLLVCSTSEQQISVPIGLKLLRVLDLEDSGINALPDSLVTLFNLRYLSLKGTEVSRLPKSIHRLSNLETLITFSSLVEDLPVGISKLQNLQCLIVDSLSLKDSSNIWKLKRLKVMDCLCAEPGLIKNLSKMTQLTRIGLAQLRKGNVNDLCNSLSKLKHLRSLSLRCIDEEEPLEIDALSLSTNIEKLSLSGKLERVPSCFKTLHNLTELRLGSSRLAEDPIPCIQAFPNLVVLTLSGTREGERLCFPEGFRRLEELWIQLMPQLTEIVIQKGAMPDLQKLYILYCQEVKRVPDGIQTLRNLQLLHLNTVSDELVERIRGEQSIDRSKVKYIPTIIHLLDREDDSYCYETLS